ncbi:MULTISPECIES: hypothetical protein [unclassified Zunongwangia]|uniref:hypothetical protein n=1 Tax=unclassified Zunongwangia TaxID=2632541 RepID=UPI0022DD7786|nr:MULTISPECIES: hypothetical protein [unclassified Zunongwangia]WBL23751.1 hypothetical protein PBT89_07270 [Zunongwangia sp. HRR-M8]WBL24185.1 hypothetical protein PBT91_09610 [Zunongwangia sp. HGR-M22]
MTQNTPTKTKDGKTAAITAYITIFGFILAIFFNMENKHKLASFHIRQAFGTHILFYVLGAIASIFTNFFIPTAFYLVYVVLAIYGLVAAIQGEFRLIPYIGEYFQKWFKSIT